MRKAFERRRACAFAVGVLAALAAAGCVAAPKQAVELNYMSSEFDAYRGTGSAVVYGQAFLRQQGGNVVVCAGEPVVLFPRTPSFDKVVALARQRIQPVAPDGAGLKEIARTAVCDAQGNFRFSGLPHVPWYVFSRVRWMAGDWPQGGDLIGEVDTSTGGEQQILLSDANRI